LAPPAQFAGGGSAKITIDARRVVGHARAPRDIEHRRAMTGLAMEPFSREAGEGEGENGASVPRRTMF